MKYLFSILFYLFAISNVSAQEDIWDAMDGPYGGYAETITIDSVGGVYAGTTTGVYRFNAQTEKWKLLGFKGLSIHSIVIRPTGEGIISAYGGFIGIYNPKDSTWKEYQPRIKDPNGSASPISVSAHSATTIDSNIYAVGRFLYNSSDGINWRLLNFPNTQTYHFIDDPIVEMSAEGTLLLGRVFINRRTTIYRSIDTGKTWKEYVIPETEFPTYSGDFYITNIRRGIGKTVFLCGSGTNGGIFRSDDDGVTWKRINNYWSTNDLSVTLSGWILTDGEHGIQLSKDWGKTWLDINLSRRGLISLDANNKIYAIITNDQNQVLPSSELLRSKDEGKTWKRWPLAFTNVGFGSITSLTDGSLLAGGRWRSTDDASWKPHSETTYSGAGETVINANGDLFSATDAGVLRSLDNGKTWEQVFTDGYYMNDITINKRGWIYAIGEAVAWWSKDNGKTWEANKGSSRASKTIGCDYQDWIYSGFGVDSILRSKDYGETWQQVQVTSIEDRPSHYYDFAFDTKHRVLIGTEFTTLLRSTDDTGESYTKLAEDLGTAVRNINVDSSGNLYINGHEFWRSVDDGESWQLLKGSDVDKVRGSNAYPAPSGHVYVGAWTGTYKSRIKQKVAPFLAAREQGCGSYKVLIIGDTLQSVSVVDSLLSNVNVVFDTITPKKSIRVVCTLLDNSKPGRFGITAVNTNGMKRMYEDIIFTPLAAPTITQNEKKLHSSTARKYQWFVGDSLLYKDTSQTYKPKNSGNYKVRITDTNWCDAFSEPFAYTTVSSEEFPAELITSLSQNSPNPLSEKTEISYTLATSGKIKLNVLDIFGNTVAIIDEGFKESGSYTVEFVTKNMPSGIYFYRLEVDGKMYTRQMSIVR